MMASPAGMRSGWRPEGGDFVFPMLAPSAPELDGGIVDDEQIPSEPEALRAILDATSKLGFGMASEPKTGAFLAALAASKPGGNLLELGTGTGLGTAWILAGMDADSKLETVDTDAEVVAVAREHLGGDARVTFHLRDGAEFIAGAPPAHFDFIYADAWPGKFTHLDEGLALLRAGGIYFVDDLLPQPNWPEAHGESVAALIEGLEGRPGFTKLKLSWASGLMLVVRA